MIFISVFRTKGEKKKTKTIKINEAFFSHVFIDIMMCKIFIKWDWWVIIAKLNNIYSWAIPLGKNLTPVSQPILLLPEIFLLGWRNQLKLLTLHPLEVSFLLLTHLHQNLLLQQAAEMLLGWKKQNKGNHLNHRNLLINLLEGLPHHRTLLQAVLNLGWKTSHQPSIQLINRMRSNKLRKEKNNRRDNRKKRKNSYFSNKESST